MATKCVIDFDCNLVDSQSAAPTSWENTAKPFGVYASGGVLLRNPNIDNIWSNTTLGVSAGRTTGSTGYGQVATVGSNPFSDTHNTMIGLERSVYGIGAEVWVTFDVRYFIVATSTVSTAVQGVFRWGDLSVRVKSVTFTSPTYTVVYNVYNGASIVATVTVPDTTSAVWHYVKIHAKLDAATGLIDVNIDGISQSVAYTGQDTRATTALASTGTVLTADFIYVGPPTVRSNEGYATPGIIDNVGFFDTDFPAGRLIARRWSMGATSTDTNWSAVGTAATTVPDALLLPTDAKAARGTGVGANTLITMAGSFDFTGMQSDMIGVNVYLKRPAQLDAFAADRHIATGLSRSGVHTMGTIVVAQDLHVDNVLIPPNTNYTFGGLGEGIFGNGLTQALFPTTTIRLLVS